jgi:rhamnogalacturonyl hydrolase YesR
MFTLNFTFTGAQKITDTNTPLHALQPDYPVPYGAQKPDDIKAVLDRIFNYLDASTPPRLVDRQTKAPLADPVNLVPTASFETGVFRLVSYEWGVTYGALLSASEITGDTRYRDYTVKRIELIARLANYFRTLPSVEPSDNPVRTVTNPRSLDDAGSMCAAMIKTYPVSGNETLKPLITNYLGYITEKQQRLADGTLSRNRPLPDALWLDDLYMSVPALARAGKLTGDMKYFDDACRQIIQFSDRMFNTEKGLYMHGWIQGMDPHPQFHWGRCNGWAILAMTELLDVLPSDHPSYKKVMDLYRAHAKGISSYQSGTGFWHQLLDRVDSYYETSATAIFTYCIAHGVNKGWIDARAYGPVAVLGWNAVQTKVNGEGQVEGTCVGTGMAFDAAFYYNRPVNVAAAHGYGPVIMAGAEMIALIKKYQIVINDSAVMFYEQGTDWRNYR